VCWDACAWIGYIAGEPDKIRPLRLIWELAQRGVYEIWTSTYDYLEVLKIRADDGDPVPVDESLRRIDEMFSQPHVKRVQLDVEVARLARLLKLTHHDAGLAKRSDAIYAATAAYYNLEELHTWDQRHLLPFDRKILRRDGIPLRIIIPGPEVEGPLFAASPAPSVATEHGALGAALAADPNPNSVAFVVEPTPDIPLPSPDEKA